MSNCLECGVEMTGDVARCLPCCHVPMAKWRAEQNQKGKHVSTTGKLKPEPAVLPPAKDMFGRALELTPEKAKRSRRNSA